MHIFDMDGTLLDTEQISSHEWPVLENALSEEVIARASKLKPAKKENKDSKK